MTHRAPENVSNEDLDEFTYSYYEVYNISVSPREDGVLETLVNGEREVVTNELLRDIHEEQGNNGWMYIDEYGQVRLTVDYDVSETIESSTIDLDLEGGNTASDEL